MELVQEKKSTIALLDLIKMILSFMIVAIHTQLFDPYLYPWLRLAVPLFFTISAYLFFAKLKECESSREKNQALKSFVMRNVKLYAFWFIVLSPIILVLRWNTWFSSGIVVGLINIVINVFIGSTFTGAWFISALVIGTVIIFFSSKKLSCKALLIIGGIIYVLVSIRSSYIHLFADMPWAMKIAYAYERFLNSPVNSFPAAIFWVALGKAFADGFAIKKKASIIGVAVSAVLLFCEWLLVKYLFGMYNNDFYIMLAPLTVSIFSLIISAPRREIKYAYQMRKISTVTYVSHGAIVFILGSGLRNLFDITLPRVAIFLITIALTIALTLVIVWLKKFKYFKWLKFAL